MEVRRRRSNQLFMRRGEHLFFDSMIVNLAASGEDPHVETMWESDHVICLLPHSVLREATAANSPADIRLAAISRFLHSCGVGLTSCESADMRAFVQRNRGAAQPKNIDDDLTHVWESAKYASRFFVTLDRRLLNRAEAIYAYKSIRIQTPEQAGSLHAILISSF
jgi:hypothetical protein